MSSIDDALAAQVRNIEADYGKPLGEWLQIVATSGLTKHNEVVAMLKATYGMKHGSAHRVSLIARSAAAAAPGAGEFLDQLYSAKRRPLRPIHDAVIGLVESFDGDFEAVPKSGYLSLRRTKQFAMIRPSTTTRVDVGLILAAEPVTERLESAAGFNALFTHRVRLTQARDVDRQFAGWLRKAYERAG